MLQAKCLPRLVRVGEAVPRKAQNPVLALSLHIITGQKCLRLEPEEYVYLPQKEGTRKVHPGLTCVVCLSHSDRSQGLSLACVGEPGSSSHFYLLPCTLVPTFFSTAFCHALETLSSVGDLLVSLASCSTTC